jgi:hypothetical protein
MCKAVGAIDTYSGVQSTALHADCDARCTDLERVGVLLRFQLDEGGAVSSCAQPVTGHEVGAQHVPLYAYVRLHSCCC